MTQLHRTPGAVLTPAARWRRVLAVIDASGLVPIVDHTLTAGVGRPRTFGARALLACLLSHGFSGRDMLFTRVTDTAASLTPEQLHDLDLDGLPVYHLIWEAFTKVCCVLRNGGLPVPGGGVLSAAQFADRLIAASIPALYTLTTSVALDGTDFETWAKRMSWAEFVSAAGTSVPEGTVIIPGKHIPTAGWPKQGTGLDTRLQHSKDPDARDGVRSGHNLSPKNVYNGFEAHLATQIPNPGGAPVPHLVTGMTLSPAGTHRGPPGVRTIESILNRGQVITDVCADRGYTPLRPETFVLPLWSRGVDVWGDLTQQQRGQRPGPIPGTLWIDGALYTSAIPEGLRHFQPPAMNANSEDRRQIHEQFDRRRPYMFTPLTGRDPAGYQRFKGPALAGKVRCPNNPRSLRLPHDRPTTTCTVGECACSRSVTISPDQMPRERQPEPWRSTAWATGYFRRGGIESVNAELKTHRADLRRGFTRVFGAVKNTLLLAFAFAATNIRILREWHAKRDLPDPWATALNEPAEPVGPRRRTARRTHTYTNLGVPPPQRGHPDAGDSE